MAPCSGVATPNGAAASGGSASARARSPKRRDRPGVYFDPRVGEGESDPLDRGLLLDGLGLLLVVFARESQSMGELPRIDALGRKIRITRPDGAARPLGALLHRRGAQRADAAVGYVFEHDVLVNEPASRARRPCSRRISRESRCASRSRAPNVRRAGFCPWGRRAGQIGAGQPPPSTVSRGIENTIAPISTTSPSGGAPVSARAAKPRDDSHERESI